MSAPILFPADFKLFVECAGRRCNDIAAQNAKLLSPVMKTLSGSSSIDSYVSS
jgi:hypothetical protein